MREHTVRADDRLLRVREEGIGNGLPVFAFHGTPGSRLLYPPHVADASNKGIRLIGYDRPGYGGSSPRRGRTMADNASDVAAIADALGLERFGVWGHSGGGAPALACAALLPDRVVGAACLAGTAPPDAEGLDHLAGMGELNVEDFHLMQSDPEAWEISSEAQAVEMKNATPEQIGEMWKSLISEVDARAVTPEFSAFLVESIQEGLRGGAEGMIEDNVSDAAAWRFDPRLIRVPLQIWHGRQDRFSPFQNGEWLADHIPGAKAHLGETEGHLTLYLHRIPEVHGWLRSKF